MKVPKGDTVATYSGANDIDLCNRFHHCDEPASDHSVSTDMSC